MLHWVGILECGVAKSMRLLPGKFQGIRLGGVVSKSRFHKIIMKIMQRMNQLAK